MKRVLNSKSETKPRIGVSGPIKTRHVTHVYLQQGRNSKPIVGRPWTTCMCIEKSSTSWLILPTKINPCDWPNFSKFSPNQIWKNQPRFGTFSSSQMDKSQWKLGVEYFGKVNGQNFKRRTRCGKLPNAYKLELNLASEGEPVSERKKKLHFCRSRITHFSSDLVVTARSVIKFLLFCFYWMLKTLLYCSIINMSC